MAPKSSNEKELLERLTRITEDNLANERFGVSQLAREMGMSRSNLHRWVKSVTDKSASQFIRESRLNKAFGLLKDPSLTVSEVAFRVGFGSATYFSKCFHEYYGYPPGEVGEHTDNAHASPDLLLETRPGAVGIKRQKTTILISFGALVAFAIFLIVILKPFSSSQEQLDKSIAVLPFRNDSPDEEKMYFVNGTMEAILNNLCKIEDLRVISRTSVEQYRDNPKPISVVAEEMNVSYLLEGSGHRDGNNVRLYVQLIDGRKDRHIWSKYYDVAIEEIFSTQSEIAQLVATEIKAVITPEEKQLIEKIPTTSQTAYEFYLRGNEEHGKYEYGNPESFDRAIDLYHYALEYDSSFSWPYLGIASIHNKRYRYDGVKYPGSLEISLRYTNKGLSLDDQNETGYYIRGMIYNELGQKQKAIEDLEKAIDINPNYAGAYIGKGWIFRTGDVEYVKSIENYTKAIQLSRGAGLSVALKQLANLYWVAGFLDKSLELWQEILSLDGDSLAYLKYLSSAELIADRREDALETAFRAYALDSTDMVVLVLIGNSYSKLGQIEESIIYYNRVLTTMEERDRFVRWMMPQIIYVLQQMEDAERAEYYIHKSIQSVESKSKDSRNAGDEMFLARIRALNGDADEALKILSNYAQRKNHIPGTWTFEKDSVWNKIRKEPGFEQISSEIYTLQRAEYERIRHQLEESDML